MARTPDGPPPAPAVQRLQLRYAKRGRLRFSSHRDFQRAFERALRRAGVPMAYSAGFTPHPKVSYAGAAPTGVASEAEYLEIAVTERLDPGRLRSALDAALPPGLDVVEVVVAAAGGGLPDRLAASVWEVRLPGVDPSALGAAVTAFLAADRVEVQRLTKSGLRTFDARSAVVSAAVAAPGADAAPVPDAADAPDAVAAGPDAVAVDTAAPGDAAVAAGGGGYAILRLVVRNGTPAVRPDDVLSGLRQVAELAPPAPPQVTRLAQGPLDEATGVVADPLHPDRGLVAAPAAASQP